MADGEHRADRIAEWETWQAEVGPDVKPGLFWYMKGFGTDGKRNEAGVESNFLEAEDRWYNAAGAGSIHDLFTLPEYLSMVVSRRMAKHDPPHTLADCIPDWAK